jgi:hypothetical protein
MSTTLGFGSGLGTATVVSLAAPGTKGVSFDNRDLISGDGKVQLAGSRYIGTLQLGGLPSGFGTAPTGWLGYYIQLTGFHDTVSAEAGAAASGPAVSVTGTLKVWNGSGYTTLTLAPGAAASVSVASINYTAPGNSQNVQMSATVSTGGTATSQAESCGSPCTRTSATATSNSPLVADMTYQITKANAVQCALTIHVDLGSLTAKATYAPAPVS